MQKDSNFPRKGRRIHFSGEAGDGNMQFPYDTVIHPRAKLRPFHGVELESSEACPKNFIILDQNYERSQVMYHPDMAHKLKAPALNAFAASFSGGCCNNFDQEASSSLKEDSDEIDALLSYDDDEDEDDDDEEASTARNYGNLKEDEEEEACSSYDCSEKRREKMKKMMKVLRRMVPGGEQMMNTACILDEAVQYLKSLQIEAQKLNHS